MNLKVLDEEDLKIFIEEIRLQITQKTKSKNVTEIEKKGAEKLLLSLP